MVVNSMFLHLNLCELNKYFYSIIFDEMCSFVYGSCKGSSIIFVVY